MGNLTETEIRGIKNPKKPIKFADGDGLFLWVSTAGTKTWRLHYRQDGKQKTFKIGIYPGVRVSDARRQAKILKGRLADGLDPSGDARAVRGGKTTWNDVSEGFLDLVSRDKSPKTIQKWEAQLRYARGIIGNLPIDNIKPKDVLAVLEEIDHRGFAETRDQARSLYSRIFRWAAARDMCETNPADLLRGAFPAAKKNSYPGITSPRDVGALMRSIRAFNGEPVTKAATIFMAHTFLRSGELRSLRWSHFTQRAQIIRIPAELTKMKRDHIVPLSLQMQALLERLHGLTGESELIFPGPRTGRPLSENTFRVALHAIGISKEQHVPHGFRTTASTLLNENGWNSDWVEAQLAHVERNKVRGAYNAAQYLDGRTEMMQWYSDHLDELEAEATQPA